MGFTTIARQRGMGNTVASHGKRNSESRADQELQSGAHVDQP
jgi:hypothetical protein